MSSGGRGYDEIREGRWCIAMNLAPVCNSMAALTGSETSPELWKMASVGPRSGVTGKPTKRGNSTRGEAQVYLGPWLVLTWLKGD